MKHTVKIRIGLLVSVCAIALGAQVSAQAGELTAVNFGGANNDAQKAAFSGPFQKQTGNKVTVVEYDGEQAKVQAMVDTKHVTWDVVEIETGDVGRVCDQGLYEKLDWSKIANKADLMPGTVQPCGAGIFVYSTALAYNADRLKTAPTGWADFWDVKKFPGKRGMRKGARYNLEFALMADSVPPQDVYKVLATKAGQDRAFKKLDQLKPYIQWWEAGAQPVQFLIAGDVAMSTVYNGRVDAARHEGKNLKVVWDGGIYDMDFWAIPKGSPNKALAEQYIAFTLSQKPQYEYAQHIAYGPVNLAAMKALDAKTRANLPNSPENSRNALPGNVEFWTDHAEELEQRFASWAAK